MNKKIDPKLLVLALFCLDKILMEKENDRIIFTLIKVISGGGFGIWWIFDIVMIVFGKYRANPLEYFGNNVNRD